MISYRYKKVNKNKKVKIMKIILYVVLIAIIAAIAYGLYVRVSNMDIDSVTETVSNAFSSAVNWLSDKIGSAIN